MNFNERPKFLVNIKHNNLAKVGMEYSWFSHMTKAKSRHWRTALCSDDLHCWFRDLVDEGHVVAETSHGDNTQAISSDNASDQKTRAELAAMP